MAVGTDLDVLDVGTLADVWRAYAVAIGDGWAKILLLAGVGGAAILLLSRLLARMDLSDRARRRVALVSWLLCVAFGTYLVIARASLFDDAFVSFRYARNLLEGHGLVWNPGERVEGYTNFLWTLLIAGLSWYTLIEPAQIGLAASLACFPLNLWLVFRLERVLSAPHGLSLLIPWATAFVAVQDSFVTAGTSGLETGFAALLVNAGLLLLMTARDVSTQAWAGLLLILATLARPDHAIFYASGAGVIVFEHAARLWKQGRPALVPALRSTLAYAAPSLLYVAHTCWRLSYYGHLFPNTFYAKSADHSYYDQGLVYAATFYLGSHLWLLLPLVMVWLVRGSDDLPTQRFKRFVALGLLVYNFFVVKVGGDFMYGRFYVVLVPLLALAAFQAMLELARSPRQGLRWAGYATALLIAGSTGGVPIIPAGLVQWNIADERTHYPVASFHPLVIEHSHFRVGKHFERMYESGLRLRVATGGIGMVGYYSRFEVIDLLGLTDAHVAHGAIEQRGRPGHEKVADAAYLAERRPHLVRAGKYTPEAFRNLARFSFADSPRPWFIYHYDREVMEHIAAVDPDVTFTRADEYLQEYVREVLPRSPPMERRRALRFFREYYFDATRDHTLERRFAHAAQL